MMKTLFKMLGILTLILTCAAFTQSKNTCSNCSQAKAIYKEIQTKQKAFLEQKALHKKHSIQDENTEERRQFEIAQGKAYQFVCDDNKKTYSEAEKKALLQFVLGLNKLHIESDAMFDLNGCFRAKVLKARDEYTKIARRLGRRGELHQFILMNQPGPQDTTIE